jgi:hypothetical protein
VVLERALQTEYSGMKTLENALIFLSKCMESAVGIATDYGLDYRKGVEVRVPVG